MYHILHLSVFWWWFLTCPFILCTAYKSKLVSNLISKLNQTHIKHIWQKYFINNAEYFILHIHVRNRWCQIVLILVTLNLFNWLRWYLGHLLLYIPSSILASKLWVDALALSNFDLVVFILIDHSGFLNQLFHSWLLSGGFLILSFLLHWSLAFFSNYVFPSTW